MQNDIASIRKNYALKSLNEKDLHADPVMQFNQWWEEALNSEIDEPNAMTLATASADGLPSARIVLLKGFSERGFVFYTNYDSYKGRQLAENPKACLVFFWKELERQVRITGFVSKTSEQESEDYFLSRPPESQAGAVISPQSHVIENRQWLENEYARLQEEISKGKTLQRPPHWGGYRVKPVIIEFWQGRPGRLHDRIEYTIKDDGSWKVERLAP